MRKTVTFALLALVMILPALSQEMSSDSIYKKAEELFYNGNYMEAAEMAGKVLQDADLGSKANILMGRVYMALENYDKAIEYYDKGIQAADKTRDTVNIAWAYNNIGVIYKMKGNYQKALDYYQKALIIDEAFNLKYGMAREYNNIANIYYILGNKKFAQLFYRKALWANQEINHIEGLGIAYNNLASYHYNDDDYTKAIEYLNYAIKYDAQL
ncbi:MAG TPA: tetratricopeptide repeat protein, partial [Candidatus Mcinerneyibacteriales bacterium]|nr:tetratricopeptide repeat protein [Candidatus Mcinerneyibacteriales bacterium]